MAEAMMNTPHNPSFVTPEENVGAPFNFQEYMNKEDMNILTTTLDGIVNMLSALDNKLNDMNNKMSGAENQLNHLKTYMQNKMKKGGSTDQKKEGTRGSGETKKTRQTDPCYICKELGHWAPDCPRKKQDSCYKCGKIGHWANQCTEEDHQFVKDIQKTEEKKPRETKRKLPLTSEKPQKKQKM
ncbi:uncharacterized protein LOC134258187 [Saccostrea cucullata]|uniref:uncharacterized protein LOC134258187 n=1 Tax=Saccostrea cuccullata TaxID=36930 RepID=UPI002ED210D1